MVVLRRAASTATASSQPQLGPSSFVAFLPLLCAGLALFASFTSTFATALLPRLTLALETLQYIVPSDAEELHTTHEQQEDFDLTQGVLLESTHPYTADCSCDHELKIHGSSYTWLHFDQRCSTVEAEARLELWSESKLIHSFAGPPSAWPNRPVILTGGDVLLRFIAAPKSSTRGKTIPWGFACRAHGYEPCFGSALPLSLDCEQGVAFLAARYMGVLVVGDPLSPEERAHHATLEGYDFRNFRSGGRAPARSRLPPGLLQVRHICIYIHAHTHKYT